MLNERFILKEKLSEGAQGLVYRVEDCQNGNDKLIAKIFKTDAHSSEIEKLIEIQRFVKVKSPYRIPKVFSQGNHHGKRFYVTRKFTTNLEDYVN